LFGHTWGIDLQRLCQNLKTVPLILAEDSRDKLFAAAGDHFLHFAVVGGVAIPVVDAMYAIIIGHDYQFVMIECTI
jgi:hypothetical protein